MVKLKEGKVDIIIGTHRLLQPDIEFKELGLDRLNKNNSNTIKTIYNMMYVRANFRGASATKKLAINSNLGLIKLVNHLASYNGLSRLCA